MSAVPVATQYSYDFVRRHLPPGARSVLEIGCGAGELAERLTRDGLDVVALDSSDECVEAAKARGIDARTVRWPAVLEQRFDAILFTRSLHHIFPLEGAIDAAFHALRPGGAIIVEDFRSELDSHRNRTWFLGLMRVFEIVGVAVDPAELERLAAKLDHGGHHELHRSTSIAQALGRYGAVNREDAAYYFRYGESELGEKVSRALLLYEMSLIEADAIDPLGARFIVHR